jgi:sugar phosphate isomerase/epimerase
LASTRTIAHIAADYGVEIAIENVPEPHPFLMKSVEDFQRFYREIGEDIHLALDIGHANINDQIERFLKTFPDKIVHIHVSDNDGKQDMHLGVGYGTVNWKNTALLLKKIDYKGAIVIESVEHVEESRKYLEKLFY